MQVTKANAAPAEKTKLSILKKKFLRIQLTIYLHSAVDVI